MDALSKKHIVNAQKQMSWVLLLSAFTLIVSVVAIGLGSSQNLDFFTTLKILFGIESAGKLEAAIIWELRFPRILMAIVGGATLAIAGSLMQGSLGNPLVSPLTLGVASGAALGAALAIILDFSIVSNSNLAIVFNAFLFSLIVVAKYCMVDTMAPAIKVIAIPTRM